LNGSGASPAPTVAKDACPEASPTPTLTITPTLTPTLTITPSITITPTRTPTKTITPTPTPTISVWINSNACVTGTGLTNGEGTYTFQNIVNGRPFYSRSYGGGLFSFQLYWDLNLFGIGNPGWRLYDTNSAVTFYSSADNVLYPWLVTNWNGSPPVTVTEGNCPDPTPTSTLTVTPSRTITPTLTPTRTITPSSTITPSITATPSITPSSTITPTITPSTTITPSITASPSITPSPSLPPTITPSASTSITPSITPSPSLPPTITPSRTTSVTPSITPSTSLPPTITPSRTPSVTPTTSPCPCFCGGTITNTGPTTNNISYQDCYGNTYNTSLEVSANLSLPCSSELGFFYLKYGSITGTQTFTVTYGTCDFNFPTASPTPTLTVSVTRTITPTPTLTRTITPSPSVALCSQAQSFSGGSAYPSSKTVSLGTDGGEVVLDFDADSVPDLFLVRFDGNIVIYAGYRGANSYRIGNSDRSSFTNSLTGKIDPVTGLTYPNINAYDVDSDGYPTVRSAAGSTSFIKTTSTTVAQVDVYAPMSTTVWYYTLNCPVPVPSITATRSPSPSITPTLTPTRSVTSTPVVTYSHGVLYCEGNTGTVISVNALNRFSYYRGTIGGCFEVISAASPSFLTGELFTPIDTDCSDAGCL